MVDDSLINILNNLPSHYMTEEDTNNYNFFKSFATVMDLTDSDLEELQNNLFISTSTGNYLDRIATMFNLIRGDLTDEELRSKIIAIASNTLGGGTNESLKTSLSSSLGVDFNKITIEDGYEVLVFNIDLEVDDEVNLDLLNSISSIVNIQKAAGTYFDKLILSSTNNIWRVNISEVNGGDYIL